MSERRVVIVGAGPAGMSAALAMVRAGVRPLVIDDNPRPGGQIYRQPAPATQAVSTATKNPLVHEFLQQQDKFELMVETTAWGIFPTRRLAITRGSQSDIVAAEHLLLAPGAYEYLPPFPGWTLPGVMTPGGAQSLVKSMGVMPGKRALVAGSGPFLLVVAEQLHRVGVEVPAVVEMARTGEVWGALPRLLRHPRLLWEGASYHRRLRRAGIPLLRGHVLIEARGPGEVREAVIAPCDENGNPDRGRTRNLAVDTICAGYGFVPRVQLAQMAGCRLQFVDAIGGWVPIVNDELETSAPGVWVAGDGGGVAGVLVAVLEGALAGHAICRRLGAIDQGSYDRLCKPIQRQLARLAKFRSVLDRVFRIRPGLTTLADASTIVCRCEELTRAEVEAGVAVGGTDLPTLKVMTRLGMGPCQGLMCWPATARLIAARTGQSVEAVGPWSPRPPIMPVTLGALIDNRPLLGENDTVKRDGITSR